MKRRPEVQCVDEPVKHQRVDAMRARLEVLHHLVEEHKQATKDTQDELEDARTDVALLKKTDQVRAKQFKELAEEKKELVEENKGLEESLAKARARIKTMEDQKKQLDETVNEEVRNITDKFVTHGCHSCMMPVSARYLLFCNNQKHSLCHDCTMNWMLAKGKLIICARTDEYTTATRIPFRAVLARWTDRCSGTCPTCRHGVGLRGIDMPLRKTTPEFDRAVYSDWYFHYALKYTASFKTGGKLMSFPPPEPPHCEKHHFNRGPRSLEDVKQEFNMHLSTWKDVACPICGEQVKVTVEAPTYVNMYHLGKVGERWNSYPVPTMILRGLTDHLLHNCSWQSGGDVKVISVQTDDKIETAHTKDIFKRLLQRAVSHVVDSVIKRGTRTMSYIQGGHRRRLFSGQVSWVAPRVAQELPTEDISALGNLLSSPTGSEEAHEAEFGQDAVEAAAAVE